MWEWRGLGDGAEVGGRGAGLGTGGRGGVRWKRGGRWVGGGQISFKVRPHIFWSNSTTVVSCTSYSWHISFHFLYTRIQFQNLSISLTDHLCELTTLPQAHPSTSKASHYRRLDHCQMLPTKYAFFNVRSGIVIIQTMPKYIIIIICIITNDDFHTVVGLNGNSTSRAVVWRTVDQRQVKPSRLDPC